MKSYLPMSDTAIHIAVCFHDPGGNYARHAGATLASIFANTKQPVCAHILHDETLTEENRFNLQQLGNDFGQSIHFCPVRLTDHNRDGHPVRKGAMGTVYRLLLPELLSVDKVIYLDCDVIVNLDIAELWDIPMTDHPVAAVPDQAIAYWPRALRLTVQSCGIDITRYFNSGIMIMNLEQIRRQYHLLDEWFRFVQQYPHAFFMDQDILNKLFQAGCRWLDAKFNQFAGYHHCPFESLACTQVIWHFTYKKPWNQYTSSVDLLYWRNLALTPWGENALEDVFKVLTRSREAEIAEIRRSVSWRLTEPLRWIATKFHSQ